MVVLHILTVAPSCVYSKVETRRRGSTNLSVTPTHFQHSSSLKHSFCRFLEASNTVLMKFEGQNREKNIGLPVYPLQCGHELKKS